jgi:aryl-phospho-beta-D-glucosidase BglC (GH1 family)
VNLSAQILFPVSSPKLFCAVPRFDLMLIKLFFVAALLLPLSGYSQSETSSQDASTQVFSSTFRNKKSLKQWDRRPSRKWCRIVEDSAGKDVLRVRAAGSNELLEEDLPLSAVAGKKLLVRLRLRSQNINGRKYSYQGVKVALHIVSPEGESYPQLSMPAGDMAWQDAGFTTVVPANATSATLMLGIEAASGEAYFDSLTVSLLSTPVQSTAQAKSVLAPDAHLRLRGMNVSNHATAEDLRELARWGANHIRWQLAWDGFPDTRADVVGIDEYRQWLQASLRHVRNLMPLCDSLGLKVVLDLHTLPGGRERERAGQVQRIFSDPTIQQSFGDIWREIAGDFRNEPALWGYDLANEPIEGYLPAGTLDWQRLAQATAQDILAVDSNHYIVIEGAPGGSPESLPGLYPLSGVQRVLYSFHFYNPVLFTHQGLYGLDTGIHYPGLVSGRSWDKAALKQSLQGIRDWQVKNNAPIYVGEFSAIRWAPDSSAFNYLRDCIDIFEEWGWSWAYHAFREADVWSVEHDSNPAHHEPSPVATDRQLVMEEAFKRNRR